MNSDKYIDFIRSLLCELDVFYANISLWVQSDVLVLYTKYSMEPHDLKCLPDEMNYSYSTIESAILYSERFEFIL